MKLNEAAEAKMPKLLPGMLLLTTDSKRGEVIVESKKKPYSRWISVWWTPHEKLQCNTIINIDTIILVRNATDILWKWNPKPLPQPPQEKAESSQAEGGKP